MTSADLWHLDPLPPGPDGDLTFEVACRTTRVGGKPHCHPITIKADWTVDTGHNLERERVAIAMGGYLSCAELVDHAVPALRHLVQLRSRRTRPTLKLDVDRHSKRRFVTIPGDTCGRADERFDQMVSAVNHACSLPLIAGIHGVNQDLLTHLLTEIENAHRTSFDIPPDDVWGASECVKRAGLDELWDLGIHPELVRTLHDSVWRGGAPPMPALFYVGLVNRRPDLVSMAGVLDGVVDESVATWLVWTTNSFDTEQSNARIDWLWAGVSGRAIEDLVNGGYVAGDVACLAELTGWSVSACASALAGWVNAGCRPTPEQLGRLDAFGVDLAYRPSGRAVDWLFQHPVARRRQLDRTILGLLMAICGTGQTTVRLLQSDVTSPEDAAYVLREGGRIDQQRIAAIAARDRRIHEPAKPAFTNHDIGAVR